MGSERLSLTVLGCDGTYPGPGGACSGYLLRCADTAVWLDAGSGTLANLQTHIQIEDIDAVVISHAHPDHWTDLEAAAVALRWVIGGPGPAVYAPAGLRSSMRAGEASGVLEWHDIDESERVAVGPIGFRFSRTDHPVPTYAVRAEAAGRSLGYSADSGPRWGLSSLGPALDLALCEATFLSDKEGSVQHMSARQAGLSAAEAGVSRLVITHLGPRVDREAARREASEAFGGEVTVAAIGDRYEP